MKKSVAHHDKIDSERGGKGMTILVVDASAVLPSSLSAVLTLSDPEHEIVNAENSEQALAILGSIPIDLLVAERSLLAVPDSELALWMKENRPETPFIAMNPSN